MLGKITIFIKSQVYKIKKPAPFDKYKAELYVTISKMIVRQ